MFSNKYDRFYRIIISWTELCEHVVLNGHINAPLNFTKIMSIYYIADGMWTNTPICTTSHSKTIDINILLCTKAVSFWNIFGQIQFGEILILRNTDWVATISRKLTYERDGQVSTYLWPYSVRDFVLLYARDFISAAYRHSLKMLPI